MLLFNFCFTLLAASTAVAQLPGKREEAVPTSCYKYLSTLSDIPLPPTNLATISVTIQTAKGSKCQVSVPTGLTKDFEEYASELASYAKENEKAISSAASGCTEISELTLWAQCASAWTDLAKAATATDNGVPKETGRALAAAAVAGIIAAAL